MRTGSNQARMNAKDHAEIAARRAAARRTASVLGAIAVAIFTAFVLSGVVGR
jgi:hypothetical protein